MKKNITDMSFDEIFPESSYPSGRSFTSDSDNKNFNNDNDFGTDDDFTYDYNDYGSDISSIGNNYTDLSSVSLPDQSRSPVQSIPVPQMQQTFQEFSQPQIQQQPPVQNFSQNDYQQPVQGNYPYPEMIPGPELGNNNWQTTVNIYEPSKGSQFNQNINFSNKGFPGFQNAAGIKNAQNKTTLPLVLGILSFFFTMFFPISITLSVVGLVLCKTETKKAVQAGVQPPSFGPAKTICYISLAFAIISAIPTLIGLLLPLFGVNVS